MKIAEIICKLEEFAPLSLAEEWDNCGLTVGKTDEECKGVLLALDLTDDVIGQAVEEGCNLIVTHHPFLFRPIKRIDYDEAKGRTIISLIKNGLTVYAMHTNLDKTVGGLNDTLCDILGAKSKTLDGCGALFTINPMTLSDFAKFAADKLCDKSVRLIGDPKKTVERVFVVSGSGGSEYDKARACADVLLTGDLKHHAYIDALADGFAIVEYSHFASEIISEEILEGALEGVSTKIIKAKQNSPFRLLEEL